MSQKPDPNGTAGRSWAETVALHRWLGEKTEAADVSNG